MAATAAASASASRSGPESAAVAVSSLPPAPPVASRAPIPPPPESSRGAALDSKRAAYAAAAPARGIPGSGAAASATAMVTASSAPTENYLAREVALSPDLNPFLNLNPETVANKHTCQAIMWQVAAWASIIGFCIIAVVACVVCAIFAPIYLPLVLGGAIPLMYPIWNLFEYLRGRADAEQAIAFVEQGVARHYQRLNTNQQLSDLFHGRSCELRTLMQDLHLDGHEMNALPLLQDKPAAAAAASASASAPSLKDRATADADRIRALLPLIARFAYWKETEQNFQNAVVAETVKKPANELERRDRNVLMLLFAQQMVMAKVNAAFSAMLIRHPNLKETAVAQVCPLSAAPCDAIVLERVKTHREDVIKKAIEGIRDRVIMDLEPKLDLMAASRPRVSDGKGSPYASSSASAAAERTPSESVFRNLMLAWNFEVIGPQVINKGKVMRPELFVDIEEQDALQIAETLFQRRIFMQMKPVAPAAGKTGETDAGSGGASVAGAAAASGGFNPLLNPPGVGETGPGARPPAPGTPTASAARADDKK